MPRSTSPRDATDRQQRSTREPDRQRRRTNQDTPERPSWTLLQISLAAISLIAVGALAWALVLNARVGSLESDLEEAQSSNATLRESANATVYQLVPTPEGPQDANGQAWFSVQGSGVLSVANMPALGDNEIFQFWYVTDNPDAPIPGGTFTVDDAGQGFMLIPADVAGVTSIGITLEPDSGSSAPTGIMLLTSDVSDARG